MHKSRLIFLTSAIAAILTTSVLAFAAQELAGQEEPKLTPKQVAELQALVGELSEQSKTNSSSTSELHTILSSPEGVGIPDMFDMQLAMNRLAQASETATSITAGLKNAVDSLIRNLKG